MTATEPTALASMLDIKCMIENGTQWYRIQEKLEEWQAASDRKSEHLRALMVAALVAARVQAEAERDASDAALLEFAAQIEHNGMVSVERKGKFKISVPSLDASIAIRAARSRQGGAK